MGLLLPVLIALVAAVIRGLYILGVFRKRQPGEPPLEKGPIPWLGHILEFRNDTALFLQRMKANHGDIFTVQLAGVYFTFVMDPLSFGNIFKQARTKLDFNKFVRHLAKRVFDYQPTDNDHDLLKASNTHLMGDSLEIMTQSMVKNLQNMMLHSIGSTTEQDACREDGLFHYSYNIVFRAGYLALFGNETAKTCGTLEKAHEVDRSESNKLFYEFRKFDKLFPRLAYGLPLPLREKIEVERLKRLFWRILSVLKVNEKENISGWVLDQQEARREKGMDELMHNRYLFGLLWVAQSNTGPSAFWLLLHLMKHPEAMKAVRKEVEELLRETGQEVKQGEPLINLTRDILLKTPVLDSAVEETLRLKAAPNLIRGVMEDMSLKMADGKEYRIRQGDQVALFPYTAVQMDPEVHPEPHTFKYNRFLTPEGSKKKYFYKNGKKLRYYNMPWGAGVSMCPGRFFATNELKQFVFLMLTYFDFELTNPDEEIPAIDIKRWGIGCMQPVRDIQFRYRLRF